jgi:hypothetical protein
MGRRRIEGDLDLVGLWSVVDKGFEGEPPFPRREVELEKTRGHTDSATPDHRQVSTFAFLLGLPR